MIVNGLGDVVTTIPTLKKKGLGLRQNNYFSDSVRTAGEATPTNIDYIYDKNPSICNRNIYENNYFIAISALCIGLFLIVTILSIAICLLVKHITKIDGNKYQKVDYETT